MDAPLCACGCGEPTLRAVTTRGQRNGPHLRYLHGHNGNERRKALVPNTTVRCACGCGQLTPLGTKGAGRRRGEPLRFVHGHNRRQPGVDLAARLWARVEKGDGCWNWTGKAAAEDGYGLLQGPDRRLVRAHRLSWELANGPIPAGQWVLHRCDNPRCVRPDHLFLGTVVENVADMMAKGRHVTQRRQTQEGKA